ncbi:MAG: dockerin type I repeat-containing protein, partial [Prevotella sp.]|nr:dockerin type I repeat-containing protein [Prevotella sp.]
CLPFAVNDFTGTPLEGATVKTLESASFDNGTLTLNFSENSLESIEAGKPYIVMWTKEAGYVDDDAHNIVNPMFRDVTISNTSTSEKAVVADIVTFKGEYAPLNIGEEGEETILYLGTDNTFRYPDGAMDINAFRAYIHANTSLGDVNGDGVVNVTDVTLLVNHILGMEDEGFNVENADVTRDGDVTVTDVTALVNLILGGNSIVKMVVNGAEGLTFAGGGNGPARAKKIEY